MTNEAIGAIILSPREVATGDPAGAALENLNTAVLGDGSLCYVSSGPGKGQWQLDKSSTDAPNGTTVVAPIAGPGRWYIKLLPGIPADSAIQVNTYDALRAITPSDGIPATTYGRDAAGDVAGQGEWIGLGPAAPGTYTDNDGTLLVPTGTGSDGSRAWSRRNVVEYDVRWFGAVPDDLAGDYSSAVQAAVDAAGVSGGEVRLPEGVIRCLSTITIANPNVHTSGVGPSSVLFCDGNNVNAVKVAGASVDIRNLTIRGNNSGSGGTVEGVGGHGVEVRAEGCTIRAVRFENLGADITAGTTTDCVTSAANISSGLSVLGCFFSDSCLAGNGSDIVFRAARGLADGNRSESQMDTGVACSGASAESIEHTVTNNQIHRTNESARHGVRALYGDQPCKTIISSNQISGCAWSGVYINGDIVPNQSVGVVSVIGNLIQNCGGTNTIRGGIAAVANPNFTIIADNIVLESGYELDGVTTRTQPTSGIQVERCKGVVVANNIIRKSTQYSIALLASINRELNEVTVHDNACFENKINASIQLQSFANGTIVARNIEIHHNIVEVDQINTSALKIAASNNPSDEPTMENVSVHNNTFTSTTTAGSGSGVEVQAKILRGSSVSENVIQGFSRQLFCVGNASTTRENCKFSGNVTRGGSYGIVGDNLIFLDHITSENTTAPFLNAFVGGLIGINSGGEAVVRVYGTADPLVGNWREGDQIYDPATDNLRVCTVAGSPGTWAVLRP